VTRLANQTHVKPQSGHGKHRRTIEPAGRLTRNVPNSSGF
jgi:hypothetical protein